MLIAATASLVGFAIESGSGHRDLGAIFALCYAAGCIAAVLLVRHSAVFTAVIQPPLLLFVAVPLAYFLIHRSEVTGLKGFLITCGYPLIERFPVMLFTSAAVLVIGMARWYFATSGPEIAEAPDTTDADAAPVGLFAALAARLSQIRRPEHGIDRSAADRPARAPRRERDRPSQARHVRPERGTDRRGDRDPRPRRQSARPVREAGVSERRRPPPAREPGWTPEPPRRAPRERRDSYPPRTPRNGGYRSHEDYPPFDPYPPRRGPRPAPPPRERDTHHPVSRVRYRGADPRYPDYPDYPPSRGR